MCFDSTFDIIYYCKLRSSSAVWAIPGYNFRSASRHSKAHAQEQPRPRGASVGAGRPARGHVAHQRGQAQDGGTAADVRHLQRHRPVPGEKPFLYFPLFWSKQSSQLLSRRLMYHNCLATKRHNVIIYNLTFFKGSFPFVARNITSQKLCHIYSFFILKV